MAFKDNGLSFMDTNDLSAEEVTKLFEILHKHDTTTRSRQVEFPWDDSSTDLFNQKDFRNVDEDINLSCQISPKCYEVQKEIEPTGLNEHFPDVVVDHLRGSQSPQLAQQLAHMDISHGDHYRDKLANNVGYIAAVHDLSYDQPCMFSFNPLPTSTISSSPDRVPDSNTIRVDASKQYSLKTTNTSNYTNSMASYRSDKPYVRRNTKRRPPDYYKQLEDVIASGTQVSSPQGTDVPPPPNHPFISPANRFSIPPIIPPYGPHYMLPVPYVQYIMPYHHPQLAPQNIGQSSLQTQPPLQAHSPLQPLNTTVCPDGSSLCYEKEIDQNSENPPLSHTTSNSDSCNTNACNSNDLEYHKSLNPSAMSNFIAVKTYESDESSETSLPPPDPKENDDTKNNTSSHDRVIIQQEEDSDDDPKKMETKCEVDASGQHESDTDHGLMFTNSSSIEVTETQITDVDDVKVAKTNTEVANGHETSFNSNEIELNAAKNDIDAKEKSSPSICNDNHDAGESVETKIGHVDDNVVCVHNKLPEVVLDSKEIEETDEPFSQKTLSDGSVNINNFKSASQDEVAINSNKPQTYLKKSWADCVKMSTSNVERLSGPTVEINSSSKNIASKHRLNRPDVSSNVIGNDKSLCGLGKLLKSVKLKTQPMVSFEPRGLSNNSNWCYVNATLQALLTCSPLHYLLESLSAAVPTKNARSSTVLRTMIRFFSEFKPFSQSKKMKLDLVESFSPTYVYEMLQTLDGSSSFKSGRQEDAEEFLSLVLNSLHEEMSLAMKTCDDHDLSSVEANGFLDETDSDSAWECVGPRNRGTILRQAKFSSTPISDIFAGYIRSSVSKHGQKDSAMMEPFFTLQLDIQGENVYTVNEALAELVNRETVFSSKSEEVVKRITLDRLPPILILHLKFFQFDKNGGCQKINKRIKYTRNLDISKDLLSHRGKAHIEPCRYKLFAVVSHKGHSLTGGHYVADIFHQGTSNWLHYDDESITLIPLTKVFDFKYPCVPYMLYYHRQDD